MISRPSQGMGVEGHTLKGCLPPAEFGGDYDPDFCPGSQVVTVRPHLLVEQRFLETPPQAQLPSFLSPPSCPVIHPSGSQPTHLVLPECNFRVFMGALASCFISSPSACFLLSAGRGLGSPSTPVSSPLPELNSLCRLHVLM